MRGPGVYRLAFLLLVAATAVRAETLTVGPAPARFAALSEALAAAQAGDTIRVAAGAYTGLFLLTTPLTLEGEPGAVLRGTGRGSVVVVAADRCTIRGFIIEHSGADLQNEDAGLLLKSNDNLVEGNQLRDVLYGIYLYHAARNTIRNNTILGRRELESGARGAGLHLWNSPDNLLEGNTIIAARDGLYIQNSPGNLIRGNRASELRYGLHYMSSDGNRFEENVFENNIAGAAIMYSRRIELRRNAFIHNRGFSSFGILFQDCEEILAEDNFIIDNATGIFMEAMRRSTIRRNVIAENDLALHVFSNTTATTLAANNFISNLSPLHLIGRRSGLQWTEAGRGNYWSDYDGYDLDGDGLGDVPHRVQDVFEYLEGNFPRLRLYLNSPAAQALAAAERSFPVIRGSGERDPSPLMKPVEIESRVGERKSDGGLQGGLGVFSAAIFAAAAAAVWGGRRR